MPVSTNVFAAMPKSSFVLVVIGATGIVVHFAVIRPARNPCNELAVYTNALARVALPMRPVNVAIGYVNDKK